MDPTHYSGPQFLFTHQSQGINFSEWISILTLCLTPLLVHLHAGYPSVVIVHGKGPTFMQKLCHLNPTSIFWRYYAIIHRRVRSKRWTEADMAASNSAFWTGHAWDGFEEMMVKSGFFCTRRPQRNKVSLLSSSALKTLIVAVQGVQAVYILVTYARHSTLDITPTTVFFPLAVLGLQRLWASLWLVDHADFGYAESGTWESAVPSSTVAYADIHTPQSPAQSIQPWKLTSTTMSPHPWKSSSAEPLTEAAHKSIALGLPQEDPLAYAVHFLEAVDTTVFQSDLNPQKCWWGIVITVLCMVLPFSFLVYAVCSLALDYAVVSATTASNLTFAILYTIILAVTTITMGVCIIRGQSNTTVIPVFHTLWYRIYTIVLFASFLSALVISTLEIRMMTCGIYTSWPRQFDAFHCRYG